jgi:alpha,alpha-trehalose phosphorylase
VIAAETGCSQLAYDYLAEAALMDIDDLEHNTSDGLHLASLAGAWIALVAGFGGFRHTHYGIFFAPRLPEGWTKLNFGLVLGAGTLRVEVAPETVTYTYSGERPLDIHDGGEELRLEPGKPVTRPVTRPEERPAPSQPAGRAPMRRTHDRLRVGLRSRA